MQQKTETNIILVIAIVLIVLNAILLGMQFMIFKDIIVLKDTLHHDISTPIVDETAGNDAEDIDMAPNDQDETDVDDTACIDEELNVAWVLKDFSAVSVKPVGWTVDQVDAGGYSGWLFTDDYNESNQVSISLYQPWLTEETTRFSYGGWLVDHGYTVALSSGNKIGGLEFDYYSTPNDSDYENAFVALYSENPNLILEIKRSATIMPPEEMTQIIDSLDFNPTKNAVENAVKNTCSSN